MLRVNRQVPKLRGLGAGGWSYYDQWTDLYDNLNKDAERREYLRRVAPTADRAERELHAWAEVLDLMVSKGVATRDHVVQYNFAANQLYAAQQRVWATLVQAGYPETPEPGRPPLFGVSFTAETIGAGEGIIGMIQNVTVDVPADMVGVKAIYTKPWWYDAVAAAKAKLDASGPNPGLGAIFTATFLVYVGIALVLTAAAGTVLAVGWLLNQANRATLEFNKLELEKQKLSYQKYLDCMVQPDSPGHQVCLEASKSIFTPGKAPSGWIEDLVGVFKWVAIAGIAGTIGYVAIKKARR